MRVFEGKRGNTSAILIGSLAAILTFAKPGTAVYLQETRTISGYVQESKILPKTIPKGNGTQKSGGHEGLSQVEVGIRGLGPTLTSDHGDFQLNVPATMKVGFPVTFYVKGWIVIDPSFSGEYGRVPLPAPELGPIPLRVARKGDKILLSDAGLRTLVLGATANFKELTALQNGRRDASSQPSRSDLGCCQPHSSVKLIAGSADDAAIRARAFFLDWTRKRADELGLDSASVQAAVMAWIDHSKTDFDAGLGELYQGRLIDAISLLKKAADRKQSPVEAQQAVAFAYGIQHDYGLAETFLQRAIEESGKLNPSLYTNLGYVLTLDGRRDEAARAFAAAAELAQSNGMKLQTQVTVPTPSPPAEFLKCTVKITNPPPDAQVQSTGVVEGVASLFPRGHLWVMTRMQGDDNWWPQGGGELRLINERWSVEVVYGVGETSRRLEVVAIVVNEEVHRSLTQWINQTEKDGIFPPIRLPNMIPECQAAILPIIYTGKSRGDSGKNTGVAPSGPLEGRDQQSSSVTSGLGGSNRSMSLPDAVNAGFVRASVWGTGASSGDSIKLSVSKTAIAGTNNLSLSVQPGTRLVSSDSSAQSMVIAGITGRMIDEDTVEPSSRIFLSDSSLRPTIRQPWRGAILPVVLSRSNSGNASTSAGSSGVYILEAYCTEFEKDNPSGSTRFSFGSVDRNLACILNKADSIKVKQAAIWIYTDGVTYAHLIQKFPISSSEWQEAESVITRCGLN